MISGSYRISKRDFFKELKDTRVNNKKRLFSIQVRSPQNYQALIGLVLTRQGLYEKFPGGVCLRSERFQ